MPWYEPVIYSKLVYYAIVDVAPREEVVTLSVHLAMVKFEILRDFGETKPRVGACDKF